MSYKKNVTWSQLKVGLIAIISITLFALTIFLITGGANFFGETMTFHIYSPDAGGLRVGAPVRLAGVDVGMVRQVSLSGHETSAEAVEIVFEVNASYAGDFREDSRAILAAEGLLGERYINISKGSPESPQIPPGGIVLFRETAEFSELVGGSRDLLDNLNVLTYRLNTVVESLETGQGTIGKLIADDTLYQRLNTAVSSAESLVSDISGGTGTLGRLITSDALFNHVNETMAKIDRTVTRIDRGEGTLGKLINDPSLYQDAQQLIARSSTLVTNINSGQGTLGKLATDEEFYARLNSAVRSMDNVMTGINSGEGTVGKLFKDQSLYNNLNLTTGEIKELMGDFRRNPKKFLTIQLKIF